mmetsp:Transcript_10433/g.14602  ORF Transcript_10433/g.14602 Transcript_10433/m.14602 type:complete len:83 (-) Transcript_10433:1226-1474(-)
MCHRRKGNWQLCSLKANISLTEDAGSTQPIRKRITPKQKPSSTVVNMISLLEKENFLVSLKYILIGHTSADYNGTMHPTKFP